MYASATLRKSVQQILISIFYWRLCLWCLLRPDLGNLNIPRSGQGSLWRLQNIWALFSSIICKMWMLNAWPLKYQIGKSGFLTNGYQHKYNDVISLVCFLSGIRNMAPIDPKPFSYQGHCEEYSQFSRGISYWLSSVLHQHVMNKISVSSVVTVPTLSHVQISPHFPKFTCPFLKYW